MPRGWETAGVENNYRFTPPSSVQAEGGRAGSAAGGGHGPAGLDESISARGCTPWLPQLAGTPSLREGQGGSLPSQREPGGVLSGEGSWLRSARP